MPGNVQPRTQIVAERIRLYWRGRPEAADTALGIAQWWLSDLEPQPSTSMVLDALRALEKDGVVEHITNVDGTVVWRLSPELMSIRSDG